jgi:uncharacterized membrane protein YdjX (TVP38/TMEM64 family)
MAPATITRSLAFAGLLLLVVLVPWFFLGAAVEAWSARMLAADRYLVALAGVLLLAGDAVLPVPSSAVAAAMGALLGAAAGTFVNALGMTLGCVAGYALGRAGTPIGRRILGPGRQAALEAWIARNGLPTLILCRAVPVLAEASMMTLGAARARFAPVMAAALAADVSLGAVYAFAGAIEGPAAAPAAPAIAAAVLIPAAAALAIALIARRGTR